MPHRSSVGRAVALSLALLTSLASVPGRASGFDKFATLSERERTFLRYVFSGDNAKATEYAEAAGINANSIAGAPLSVWFYRLGMITMGRSMYREPAVQYIVFGTFKQNPNPPNIGDTNLEEFCNYAPVPQNIQMQIYGTSAQKQALADQQERARKVHVDAMAAGFRSLLRYGLKDRRLITEIFKGCAFSRAVPLEGYFYDTVLSPMVKAGANINVENVAGDRPIQHALQARSPEALEGLIRDGAQVRYIVRFNGHDRGTAATTCTPRLEQSLYKFVFNWVRPGNEPEVALGLIRALHSGGLSPLTPWGYIDNSKGQHLCIHKSFYDAVVDTGNLSFARAIKGAVEAAPAKPAAQPTEAPPSGATHEANPSGKVSQIGQWRIAYHADGRALAIAKATKIDGDKLAGLQLECVPGGRLEYIAPALKLFSPINALWINNAGDVYHVPLVNGRASGPAAVTISQQLLAVERSGTSMGMADHWTLEMSVDSEDGPMSEIELGGFSKMRAYMLANCRK